MAVVRQRRVNLTLELPLPDSASAASDCRLRFPLPPPPAASSAAASASTSTSTSTSTSEHRLSDFEKLQVLGHGNGGTVYKVRHRRTAAAYALKVLHTDADASLRRQVSREVEILRRTDSPFVVRCHGVFPTPSGDVAVLLEHMDAGSLDSLLHRRGNRPFPEPALAEISRQALHGLAYLHSHQIVHRDLKPSNLLVNRSGEIKIADFGVGKILRRSLDPCLSYVGTCAYMSPERFDSEGFGGGGGFAGDVWALGVVLLECFVGRFPLVEAGERPDWATLMCVVCFGGPPAVPDAASPEFRSFLGRCLEKDWRKRGTVGELLSHPFVAKCSSTEGLVDDALHM